jgi:methionine-rich copper-binding protein CopC
MVFALLNILHASTRGVLLLLALLLGSLTAAAHSELRRSVPAAGAVLMHAPEQIELHFNERVQLTALRLYREGSEEISLPRRAIRTATTEIITLPPLPSGAYRAEWRIISADGHPAGGAIPFRIEAPNRP